MKKFGFAFCLIALTGLVVSTASAATLGLFEYAFNVDGVITDNAVPAGVNASSFDFTSNLGTLTATVTGAGTHFLDGFFDYEIDEATNTYFNEYGEAIGTPASGQSWEIDEPGWVYGDLFTNFISSYLDNSNGVPISASDDVAMALGWDFTLGAGETATVKFFVADSIPAGAVPSAFYLQQYDPDSEAGIYLYSTLEIGEGGGPVIPEPSSIILLISGLGIVLAAILRKSA